MISRKAPLPLYIPAVIAAGGMIIPLFYLLLRSGDAQGDLLVSLIMRPHTMMLLRNTVLLAGGVLALSLAVSLPLAWLTERTDLSWRKGLSLLGVLPLALPGYVAAYALLSIGGSYGLSARLFSLPLPRMSGYWGAAAALTIYSFPYLYLNIRTSLARLDPALEETAQSLGAGPVRIFFRIVLPHLLPALLSGSVIILIYVLGDFGVVALMRYEVFSYAIYTQYTGAFDRTYAALLSLILVALSLLVLTTEALLLRRVRLERTGTGAQRPRRRTALGVWKVPAYVFIFGVLSVTAGLPLVTLLLWMTQSPPWEALPRIISALLRSSGAALPASLVALALALPISYLHSRYPGRLSRAAERTAYIGYAVPPLALGLAYVFFSLRAVPWLYQSLFLLVLAYALNFLALAMGPVRSALYQAPRGLEEAAYSLGLSPARAFIKVILPLAKRGMLSSVVLVFVMAMKELPIALLLSPPGYMTLSMAVFARTSEAQFAEAAPYAAAIVLISGVLVALTLTLEGDKTDASA